MAGWLGGIMAPGAQYVLKDVILAAAWLVLTAEALGARMSLPSPAE